MMVCVCVCVRVCKGGGISPLASQLCISSARQDAALSVIARARVRVVVVGGGG